MRTLLLLTGLLMATALTAQHTLRGSIRDENNQPVAGAAVSIEGTFNQTISDVNGEFFFREIKPAVVTVIVQMLGYQRYRASVSLLEPPSKGLVIFLQPRTFLTDEVVISATRADDKSAMAFTTMQLEEIRSRNFGQDLPFLLNNQPGVVVNSDAGAGVGYTGIRVRGSDPTRINVTVNGIPMNDAESHGLFWVNMPDFASSVSSIQLQRGAGTSTNGAGAFGATLNMQTNTFRGTPYAAYTGSAGSFNTLRNTFEAGTGLVNGFTFDVRLSKITSDGFIERAASDLKSFFVSGAWYGKKTTLRANVFSGRETTYQAWYGVPQDSLSTNPRYNPAGLYFSPDGKEQFYDNETDNYQQDHYQFFATHQASRKLQLHAALHYTRGRGYFEQYRQQDDLASYGVGPYTVGSISLNDSTTVPADTITQSDLIRRRWLDNHFYGVVYSATWTPTSRWRVILGGGANRYEGAHFGEVIWAQFGGALPLNWRYYDNDAVKTDVNVYLKANYDLTSRLSLFADLQQRWINYSFLGFNNLLESVQQDVALSFFNPKAGLTWNISDKHRVFASWSVAQREPVRDDFTQSSVESRPRPERMNDFELGYRYQGGRWKWGATAYYMAYKDALVLTGAVNDVGAYNRVNIPESYRAGLELEMEWNVAKTFDVAANLALSDNRVVAFTEFVDDYDNGGQVQFNYTNTPIAFSPAAVGAGSFTWKPSSWLSLQWMHKYVGEQYLDNTGSEERKLDAFYVSDMRLSTDFDLRNRRRMQLSFLVANVFDALYAPNGYTFSGLSGGQRLNFNYLYPQAGRNFMVMLRFEI